MSYTGLKTAEVLKSEGFAGGEMRRNSNNHHTAVDIKDNVQNMDFLVRVAGLSPHIKCFAHFKSIREVVLTNWSWLPIFSFSLYKGLQLAAVFLGIFLKF